MRGIIESVVESLDGTDNELFPYLPYILQDLWEFGADPSIMLTLIKENIQKDNLRILDLACGKGAVSIKIAKELNCIVKGIDATPEFIESAKNYAVKFQVSDRCEFEVGDIRTRIHRHSGFDIIILGAIGPIFGNISSTLKILRKSLTKTGYVLLDDGYIEDNLKTNYTRCQRKSEFYKHINQAGFEIVKEVIFDKKFIKETDNSIFRFIEQRINELIDKIPEKKDLFRGYLKSQEYEGNILENELTSGTWLLQLKAVDINK